MQIVQASHGECLFCPQSGTMEVSSPEWSIILCPSCAGELKAALPDAPDWKRVALTAAEEIEHKAAWFRTDGGKNKHARAQAILEAAQRLVEAAGHLVDSETTDRKGGE